ncbi:MAG: co-chaperone GroES [Candidatus Shikimatogenerans sp. AspAUS03]|uniref:10 kDa chaperonin n=1 Tax=Candidatus Shikimatogenerans sp. AspAUS03 TaxID=3158563 RepID=A0AAU7QUY4_9FLAO
MIIPLHDRVLILPIKNEKTKIIDFTKEKTFKGKIIAVGQGKHNHKMIVKINDIVIFNKYSINKIRINKKKYFILHESDILAIINE